MKYINVNGEQHEIDLVSNTLTVHFGTEDWDDFHGETPEQQIILAAENDNDFINEDFEVALSEIGYQLDTSQAHSFSRTGDMSYVIVYNIKKLD